MTEYTRRKQRRRVFAVKVGVYFAIVAGVIAQSAVQRFDAKALTINLDFTGWSIVRVVVAMAVATIIYQRLDGSGELSGKIKNVGRVLWLGAASGYALMGIAGIGE